MTGLGALPLDRSATRRAGCDLHQPELKVSHALRPDGRVHIRLPADGVVSDAQARRLAWAILADLAPDEVVPAAEVVTYREAQRLAVLRAVTAGARTASEVAAALSWAVRTSQRRLSELVADGRLTRRAGHWPEFQLSIPGAK